MSPEAPTDATIVRRGTPDLETVALIGEYAALRAEIMHRITNQLTIVGGNIALLTIAFTSFREQFGHATMTFELLLAPLGFMVVAWWFFQQDILIAQAAAYLHKILRPMVEARLARDLGAAAWVGIMQWESRRTQTLLRRIPLLRIPLLRVPVSSGAIFESLDPAFRLAATLGPGIAIIVIIYIVAWSRPEFVLDAGPVRLGLFIADSLLLMAFFGIPWHIQRLYRDVADESPSKNSWLISSLVAALLQLAATAFVFGGHDQNTRAEWHRAKAQLNNLGTRSEQYAHDFVHARTAASAFARARRREGDVRARAEAARGERESLAAMYATSARELCSVHDYLGMMDDIYGSQLTAAARHALRDVEVARSDGLHDWSRAIYGQSGAAAAYERAGHVLDRSQVADQWLTDALQTVSHRVNADVVRQPIDVQDALKRHTTCDLTFPPVSVGEP